MMDQKRYILHHKVTPLTLNSKAVATTTIILNVKLLKNSPKRACFSWSTKKK